MKIKNRIRFHVILGLLCMVMPYLITIIMITVTMNRIIGMELSVIPGLISVHIIFGLIFLRVNLGIRLLISLIVGAIVYVIAGQIMFYEFISTHRDLYGYWDLTITNWVVGVILWEAFYHIMRVIENLKQIKNGANIG